MFYGRLRRSWLVLLLALAPAVGRAAEADKPKSKEPTEKKFVRLERDAAGKAVAFQTAVVHFVPATPGKDLQVDLVGAIHVGEPAYYEALNRDFEKYDAVLYELVAPPGTRVTKETEPGNHPVSVLQRGLKDMLELEHQLQGIDYTKANLVHADMSPEQFAKSMKDRGESFWTLFFRMMGQAMVQQADQQAKGKSSDLELLMALFDKNRAPRLKRALAEQFEEVDGMMDAIDGPNGSTILSERNKVALEVLSKQIAGGKRRIAIFYGAGHLPDMERRLLAEFGLKRTGERWMTAWNLRDPKQPARKPALERAR